MNVIGNASNNSGNSIIEQKFIERTLTQEAQSIVQEQNRILSRYNPNSKELIMQRRTFTVKSSNNLEFVHAMAQRFIDMKRLRGRKRNPIPIHNKIIYTHFNSIINQMAFGLTDDVRQLIAKQYNIQL